MSYGVALRNGVPFTLGTIAALCVNATTQWNPLALFANGEKGAWYDPSDFSTMFQDSAGTTPVTAVGQPVGLIRDKSGNNNHAFQATPTARPLLQKDTSDGYYLDFNGIDDCLQTAAVNLTTASKVTVFAGTANQKTVGTGTLLEFSPNYMNNVGGFAALTPSLSTSHASFGSNGGAAGEKETQAAPAGQLEKRVLTMAQDFATLNDYGCDYIRFNQIPLGNLIGAGNTAVGAGPFGNFPAFIGARNNGTGGNFLWGRIYSLVFVGEMYPTNVLVQMEEWIDAKMHIPPPTLIELTEDDGATILYEDNGTTALTKDVP